MVSTQSPGTRFRRCEQDAGKSWRRWLFLLFARVSRTMETPEMSIAAGREAVRQIQVSSAQPGFVSVRKCRLMRCFVSPRLSTGGSRGGGRSDLLDMGEKLCGKERYRSCRKVQFNFVSKEMVDDAAFAVIGFQMNTVQGKTFLGGRQHRAASKRLL